MSKTITITTLMWASYCSILNKAWDELKKELSHLNVDLRLYSTKDMPDKLDDFLNDAKKSDIVFMYRTSTDDFYEDISANKFKNLIVTSQDPTYWNSKLSHKAYLYTVYGGVENFKNLIMYLIKETLNMALPLSPPKELPFQGIFYRGEIFENLDEFLNNADFNKKNTIGVLFSRHYLMNEDMGVINALISKLEKYFNIIPVFSYGAKNEDLNAIGGGECILKYFFKNEKPIIDTLINLLSFPLGTVVEKGSLKKLQGIDVLKKLNIPVFHPIVSYYKTYEEWKNDIQGLSADIGWTIALPEFEGVIEPILIGTVHKEGNLEKKMPIDDRIDKVVKRIKKWMELKNKPKKDRKVIFVLHNAACASVEATVGSAAHLDSFESLIRIMKKMNEEGYCIENIPKNGNELAKLILDKKAISEFRWTTVNEIIAKGGHLYLMDEEEYMEYFKTLPENVKKKVLDTWGDLNGKDIPASMIYKDSTGKNKIVITGLEFGNIYVCVQPKRGCAGARCDGNVCKILHDPECPPTHQYIATYKYFSEIADVIVHVGTHGTLEFLPGKNVGLSNECYPDICINDIPHLYIYNSDNPPEGTIAKRRSYAVLIDHMQTVMTDAMNEELETLDNYVNEYLKDMNTSRRHQLEHLIIEEVKKTNLLKIKEKIENISKEGDIGAKRRAAKLEESYSIHSNFKEIFDELRNTLEMIKNSKINDGMHIFGELPSGERKVEFINTILEFEYKRKMQDEIKNVLDGINIEDNELKEKIFDINERLEQSKEINALLNAIDVKYIEPGPSGLITRGRDDILPTGRNFYSLDPYKIPTKAAYRVGVLLAEKLIEKYINENGKYPENVASYWMASDIMWSDGEGMAQILHLLGVKPKWKHGTIVGVEVIPLEELGRPRIDVTIRVSGILRDNFPNCIEIVDEAITKVAKLDEPIEMNFVKKHVLEGLEKELSLREATYRIFSSKPGTYGNGVKYAIYSSAWENEEDLKDAFMLWNSYAYGKNVHGTFAKDAFESILKSVDLTFNKTVTDEYDLFGCCSYFGTHGGLTNAARVISKKDVKVYYEDTRNPNKVEIRTLKEEIERVSLSKLLNPKWIEGMKRHDYKGAGDIAKRVGRVFGWSATTKEVDNWVFDEIFNTHVKNEENRKFFKENNIYALEEISRRLLEAYQRGLWKTSEENLEELKRIYMEIEGDIEDTYGDVDIGDFQGGGIDIDLTWKDKLKENLAIK